MQPGAQLSTNTSTAQLVVESARRKEKRLATQPERHGGRKGDKEMINLLYRPLSNGIELSKKPKIYRYCYLSFIIVHLSFVIAYIT
jgi:hypothetical protein